jgi:pyrroline-5-carboxylate reductase
MSSKDTTQQSTKKIEVATKKNNTMNDSNVRSLRIGVIGCGTIASAIVTGLAKYQHNLHHSLDSTDGKNRDSNLHIERIVITNRSETKSLQLQALFPNLVSVSESNQNVLDLTDIVFITVLPNQTASVLQELQFSPHRHVLISLVSTCSIDMLHTDARLPKQQVYKMICLPGVQYNNDGICLFQIPITTTNPTTTTVESVVEDVATEDSSTFVTLPILMELLGILGHVVTVTSDEQMSTYMVPTGLMGLFYGTLRTNRNWIVQNDPCFKISPTEMVDTTTVSDQQQQQQQQQQQKHRRRKIATQLVLRCYNNMIQDAIRRLDTEDDDNGDNNSDTDLLDTLIHEQTSGGLNEQALANGIGIMDIYEQVQDAMLLRILGKSDGSIPK